MNYPNYSSSGLTLNLNTANIPLGPSLIPPPPSIKEESLFIGESKQPFVNEPVFPPQSTLNFPSVNISRPSGQLRSRYVLPTNLDSDSNILNPPIPPSNLVPSTNNFVMKTDDSFNSNRIDEDIVSNSTIAHFQAENSGPTYEQVSPNWFYATKMNSMTIWWPFDTGDSVRLETEAVKFNLITLPTSGGCQPSEKMNSVSVPVRGGRYDVLLHERQCRAVYWDEERSEVRRVTWLFRPQNEPRVLPFSEKMCALLEEKFQQACTKNVWGEKFTLPSEENDTVLDSFIFYGPQSMIQYPAYPFRSYSSDDHNIDTASNVCILHRGLSGELSSQLAVGDTRQIEHVVFVVHGIGSIYNVRGEGLVACVNDMRRTAESLMSSHFPGATGRVEFLPVHWHSALHSEATGINNQLRRVTLESIPKLRNFTNNTLTDILFYTSPKYCQHITNTVASSIIQLKQLFLQRNPHFSGTFAVVGHSLGSVILFDLLSHQHRNTVSPIDDHLKNTEFFLPQSTVSSEEEENFSGSSHSEHDDWSLVAADRTNEECPVSSVGSALLSDVQPVFGDQTLNTNILRGKLLQAELSESQIETILKSVSKNSHFSLTPGVGMPIIQFPQLGFPLSACFMLGSPLSLFLTARGIHRLPSDFRLPTCSSIFNIFHPFDPVAYRLETILVPGYKAASVLMPHHKGRKRIHLELKDNLTRVGYDIKSRVYESLRSTWRTFQEFASAHNSASPKKTSNDPVDVVNDDESDAIKRLLSRISEVDTPNRSRHSDDAPEDEEEDEASMFSSHLNQGRRIDYVLQEAPLESLNAYLFALTSHGVYWESEDCVLFILNELFSQSSSPYVDNAKNSSSLLERNNPIVNINHVLQSTVKSDSITGINQAEALDLQEISLSFNNEVVSNRKKCSSDYGTLSQPSHFSEKILDIQKSLVFGANEKILEPNTGKNISGKVESPNLSSPAFPPLSLSSAPFNKSQFAPIVYSHNRTTGPTPKSVFDSSNSRSVLSEFDFLHIREGDQKMLEVHDTASRDESSVAELVSIELSGTDRSPLVTKSQKNFHYKPTS